VRLVPGEERNDDRFRPSFLSNTTWPAATEKERKGKKRKKSVTRSSLGRAKPSNSKHCRSGQLADWWGPRRGEKGGKARAPRGAAPLRSAGEAGSPDPGPATEEEKEKSWRMRRGE